MRVVTALLIAVVTTASTRGDAPSPPTLAPDVKEALSGNSAIFSNILITGERSRRFLAPAEAVLKTFQTLESEAEFIQRTHFELRFQGPRFRESIAYPPGDTYTHDVLYESSFDGKTFRLGYKTLENLESSEVHIHDPVKAAEFARKHDEPSWFNQMKFWYLFEAGFIGPQTMYELGQPVESVILKAAEHQEIVSVSQVGGENGNIVEVIIEQPEPWQSSETFDIETHEEYVSMINGSDILNMRMERERRQLVGKYRVIRLRLNRALGYAVEEKWESRKETGETMFHTKNSDFVQVGSDGVWMPKRCVVESHAYRTAPLLISSDPLYETVIQMDQCDPGDFDEDEFRIWYDVPGVTVSDWRVTKGPLDDPEVYRVPSSADDLPKKRRIASWLVMFNIVCIAGWLVWLYVRSRKKRSEV